MKCTTIITQSRDEEIIIYAKERTELIGKIERLASENEEYLLGFCGAEIVKLSPLDIQLFTIKGGKLYAITDSREYALRERLYIIEDRLGKDFIKINQSCIANLKKIKSFNASFGGALCVVFQNGYTDFVSRRQLKAVKNAIGI